MPVIYQKRICRDDLRRNPDAIYLFGDNEARTGLGGQAREMRAEPNAFGIATKKSPYEFWSDETFECNTFTMYGDYLKINRAKQKYKTIIIPSDGLGTGLAQLATCAPKTFEYLTGVLKLIVADWKGDA